MVSRALANKVFYHKKCLDLEKSFSNFWILFSSQIVWAGFFNFRISAQWSNIRLCWNVFCCLQSVWALKRQRNGICHWNTQWIVSFFGFKTLISQYLDGNYQPLGKIELFLQDDGNYTGRFEANAGVSVDKIYASLAQSKQEVVYSVRSGDIFSSNEVSFLIFSKFLIQF